MQEQPLFRPARVGARHFLQRHGERLDDEVVDRELEGARTVLRRHAVEARARGKHGVELAVDAEIEMRDGLLGEREPLGNDPAHGVVRHKLVAARLVERQHLLVGQAPGRRRPRQREAALRLWARLDGFDRLRVVGDAAASAAIGGMSRLTMRPFGPEPRSLPRSMPRWRASLRASGEAAMRFAWPPSPLCRFAPCVDIGQPSLASASFAIASSQCSPSNIMMRVTRTAPSSRQRTLTLKPSGLERGT